MSSTLAILCCPAENLWEQIFNVLTFPHHTPSLYDVRSVLANSVCSSFCNIRVYQIIMFYALNSHNVRDQLHVNKAGRKKSTRLVCYARQTAGAMENVNTESVLRPRGKKGLQALSKFQGKEHESRTKGTRQTFKDPNKKYQIIPHIISFNPHSDSSR